MCMLNKLLLWHLLAFACLFLMNWWFVFFPLLKLTYFVMRYKKIKNKTKAFSFCWINTRVRGNRWKSRGSDGTLNTQGWLGWKEETRGVEATKWEWDILSSELHFNDMSVQCDVWNDCFIKSLCCTGAEGLRILNNSLWTTQLSTTHPWVFILLLLTPLHCPPKPRHRFILTCMHCAFVWTLQTNTFQ